MENNKRNKFILGLVAIVLLVVSLIVVINNKEVDAVTGYYYQFGSVYCLFAKIVDKNVYVLNFNKTEGVGTRKFKKIDITDVEKLSLYDVLLMII